MRLLVALLEGHIFFWCIAQKIETAYLLPRESPRYSLEHNSGWPMRIQLNKPHALSFHSIQLKLQCFFIFSTGSPESSPVIPI